MSISRSNRTYYTKEEYEAAKRNDNALLYAQRQGYDLVRTGRYFYMRQHDSLVFAPSGAWFWNSRGLSGRALEFIVFYEGRSFPEAVLILAGAAQPGFTPRVIPRSIPPPVKQPQPIPFVLPKPANNDRQLFAYLCGRRKLEEAIVQEKWSCVKISRILRNATYMGYICYNKSRVNNFLEKKRIKNLDEDSFVLVKGDFEPIVSETLWRLCERIRKGRIQKYQMPSGEERRRGSRIPQHLWVRKLRCRCGAGYSRFKWRVLQDGTPIYGYQCNFRSQNPAKSFIEQNQIQGQKSCDAISLCEWKLDLMAKRVFEYLWGDQKEAVLRACQMIESCLIGAAAQSEAKQNERREKIQKLEQRILNLGEMRADGELTKEQYQELYSKATGELTSLKNHSEAKPQLGSEPQFDLSAIKKGLAQLVDISTAKISDELIEEFVEAVMPIESYTFRWKMNLGNTSAVFEPANLLAPHILPVCSFTIDFENARQYRIANNLPLQFRRRDWHDLVVEVFV